MELGAIFPDGNGWTLYGLWNVLYFACAVYIGVLALVFLSGPGPQR